MKASTPWWFHLGALIRSRLGNPMIALIIEVQIINGNDAPGSPGRLIAKWALMPWWWCRRTVYAHKILQAINSTLGKSLAGKNFVPRAKWQTQSFADTPNDPTTANLPYWNQWPICFGQRLARKTTWTRQRLAISCVELIIITHMSAQQGESIGQNLLLLNHRE